MKPIYKVYNPQTKRHEEIAVNAITPRQQVVKMFWSAVHKEYYTVPGASLVQMNQAGELVVVE